MSTQTSNSLRIGQIFEKDLYDATGLLVLPAGKPVGAKLLEILANRGCTELFFPKDEKPVAADESPLLKPYSEDDLVLLQATFEQTPDLVDAIARALQAGQFVEPAEIDESVDNCLKAVESDPAAVLASALGIEYEDGESAALHNVRMSAMAMVAANLMGFSNEEVKAVGRSGLLHDISLLQDRRELAIALTDARDDDPLLIAYRQHPVQSAEMLRTRMKGISELELILVAQVHEQCDGTGFPRGLKKQHLHPLSRLLNIVDAFLTLIDEQNPHGGYQPADALAYLIVHSLYGSFDRACIQALIGAAAAYPVGTKVMLDDNSVATVMRSTGEDYLMPVVQLESKPGRLIDLRNYTRQIVGPLNSESLRRLPKAMLHKRLWQLAI